MLVEVSIEVVSELDWGMYFSFHGTIEVDGRLHHSCGAKRSSPCWVTWVILIQWWVSSDHSQGNGKHYTSQHVEFL